MFNRGSFSPFLSIVNLILAGIHQRERPNVPARDQSIDTNHLSPITFDNAIGLNLEAASLIDGGRRPAEYRQAESRRLRKAASVYASRRDSSASEVETSLYELAQKTTVDMPPHPEK